MLKISKEDYQKILALKDRMTTTYKVSTSQEQKKRLVSYLAKIERLLKDISSGKEIDPARLAELNIKISKPNSSNDIEHIESLDDDTEEYLKDDKGNFVIEYIEIPGNKRDNEINEVYSYFIFMESVYLPPISQAYLKMDFNFGKDRDIVFNKFDIVKHLFSSYVDDYKMLTSIMHKKEQYDAYKERIKQQRQYLLVKLGEFLNEFNEFVLKIIDNVETNKPNILNPDDIYKNDFIDNKYLEGKSYRAIAKSLHSYIIFFISILRIPNFKR